MKSAFLLVAWLATVGGAFYVGTRFEPEGPAPAPVEDLTGRATSREAAAPDPGPVLRPGPGSSRTPGSAFADAVPPAAEAPSAPEPGVTLGAFELAGVNDTEVALAMFKRHLSALLARGKEGHLDLLQFLNDNLVENEDLQRLFASEADGARIIYPLVEFLVSRKGQVVDVVETVYETLAEDPEAFADFDDNTLEIFTEGVSFVLPGAVSEARLDDFRGHARKFLARDEATLPPVVKQVRKDVERVLGIWAPRLDADESLERLKSGELQGAEALEAIRKIPPEQLAGIDLAPYLAAGVAQGDWQTLRAMRDVPLSARDIAVLDQAMLEGSGNGRIHEWNLRQYLQATHRSGWPAAQELVELGLRQITKEARAPYAQVLGDLDPKPASDYARWVLDTYELPPHAVNDVKRSFGIE